MKRLVSAVMLGTVQMHIYCSELKAPVIDGKPLFTQSSSDPAFEAIKDAIAKDAHTGVKGSEVHLNLKWVETLAEAKRPIDQAIKIHTLLNSAIGRKDFNHWSRWYQEQGHTQIFRLFKDEVNVHNSRPLAGRVEAHTALHWTEAEGKWHDWSGVITPIKSIGINLQVKNTDNDWAVAVYVNEDGKVKIDHRRGKDQIIDTGKPGNPVFLQVRDNGLNYEVFIDHKKVGEGSYKRPTGTTAFRWGMYVGEHEIKHDAMILFSGVTVDSGK